MLVQDSYISMINSCISVNMEIFNMVITRKSIILIVISQNFNALFQNYDKQNYALCIQSATIISYKFYVFIITCYYIIVLITIRNFSSGYFENWVLSKIMPLFKISDQKEKTEAPRLNFGNRNELRIDYDVESSFGRGGLHFGSPATCFVCRHLIR